MKENNKAAFIRFWRSQVMKGRNIQGVIINE